MNHLTTKKIAALLTCVSLFYSPLLIGMKKNKILPKNNDTVIEINFANNQELFTLENIPDELFIDHILPFLELNDIHNSMALVKKRFCELTKNYTRNKYQKYFHLFSNFFEQNNQIVIEIPNKLLRNPQRLDDLITFLKTKARFFDQKDTTGSGKLVLRFPKLSSKSTCCLLTKKQTVEIIITSKKALEKLTDEFPFLQTTAREKQRKSFCKNILLSGAIPAGVFLLVLAALILAPTINNIALGYTELFYDNKTIQFIAIVATSFFLIELAVSACFCGANCISFHNNQYFFQALLEELKLMASENENITIKTN
ncbi:hypothetical protein KKA53_04545 [Candidatus Dependentiae bacterium]|nr:hypothetical protein [Candidatus Dependentiae bacterium]